MIRKFHRVLSFTFVIVLGLFSSNTFALAPNMDGWSNVGKPYYLQGNTKFTNASDISGSNIMSRLRSSYTYKNRRTKVLNSVWRQEKMYTVNSSGSNYHYANITYDSLPNNLGYGYTEWYDSPQGIFLDYETQFITGKIVDSSHGSQNPVTDSIYYNRIQYPGTQQTVFIGSTQANGDLADAKSASILNRRGKTNYPIYFNKGTDLDSAIATELNSKNVRNVWILGGSERFTATAGLGKNFNVIRVGGVNRNETLEFMKSAPEKLKLPSKYSGDSNGIVIKGSLGWLQSSVYNKLLNARNNKDVNSIISAANDIFNNITVGSSPYPGQEPAVVIGVNYNGWESYVSIYYSQLNGSYVYQFILPGYFDAYEPINNWVDVTKYDYKNGNDYWVKPGSTFSIYTESRMKNYPYGLYPTNTEAFLESWDNNKYTRSVHGLYPWNNGLYTRENFTSDFNVISGEKAYNWQRTDSGVVNNYISGTHVMSAKYNNRNYKVSSSGNYINFNSWIGNTPYYNGKWIKTDGDAPVYSSIDVENKTDSSFDIKIKNVSDNNRSGVKKVVLKVWVNNGSGKVYEKEINLTSNSSTYQYTVNKANFGNNSSNYYYTVTLTDNVGNSRTYTSKVINMLKNNLTANRIDIYDPRENRYVSQVISGQEYVAVLEVKNTGETNITKSFDIGFKIENEVKGTYKETTGISKGQTKEYRFKFIAGNENLSGVIYEGIADYSNNISESNEKDNNISSEKPYSSPRSDTNPPIIPTSPPGGGKITNPVPIITVKVDLVAEYIDIVELNSESSVTEAITDDEYRIKYKIKNNSSLSFKNLDISKKSFKSEIYYGGILKGSITISDMNKDEVKTYYQQFKVPLLSDGIAEEVKSVNLNVDTTNNIFESNENNNTISRNKKIIGLKLTDYRITDVVNPIAAINYPIYTNEMPLSVKAGYNVTFKINVLGKPDSVYAKISDSRGKDYGKVELTKVKDIDNVRSEWTYTFAPDVDTEENTIIITEIYGKKNSFEYNYNLKENWSGNTLKIGGSAKEDIIIYRKY